ncbi:MAG: NupC/NupG family nucleoside CNT transporter [Nesterenkonia sp.]|nr:NupC/NupG family nucleoside CNT transporter [Nesterenkonia sp.]
MIHILWGILGMTVVLGIAVLASADRRKIKIRPVAFALLLQVTFAFLVLYTDTGRRVLQVLTEIVQGIIDVTGEGTAFLFGGLVEGDSVPFALSVLPVIIFFASLTAVLYHLKIMQVVVRIIGGGLQKLLGTSRAESMNAAANIFVGQTEAPLVIRPYVAGMTKSELFAVMVGGLSTVAGSVLVGYSQMGADLEYLIAACFMAAPAALLMAKIIVPAGSFDEFDAGKEERELVAARKAGHSSSAEEETEGTRADTATAGRDDSVLGGGRYVAPSQSADDTDPATGSDAEADAETDRSRTVAARVDVEEEDRARNVIDAAARGAGDGLKLAANVGAMLLAFIALIALLNLGLGQIGGLFGNPDITFQEILGFVFAPLMWAVGVPWEEAVAAGSFLGQKLVLNEFVAFADFGPQADGFSAKTQAVVTFALTGFANFSSLAILLGGLGSIAPARRSDIAQLGLRAVLAGTLANLMSAAIAGMILF